MDAIFSSDALGLLLTVGSIVGLCAILVHMVRHDV